MGLSSARHPSLITRIKTFFVGKPLSTENLAHERIPKWKALAVLSSDALSSVAYATEEVLIPLSLFAFSAMNWSLPIAMAVGLLLVIVTVSYRETIDAYPGGGGAYTVAKENIGTQAGLVAGAALLIDYVLTVAVSVAAGIQNIVSAFPDLGPHKVAIGVIVIFILMIFNLRGIRESASIFALPTYLFIVSFVVMIGVGAYRFATGEAVPVAPLLHEQYPEIPIFLLLRAFASGCSALTGIEAISNGIPVFREPSQKNAKKTMLWMSSILGFLFLSITALAHLSGIVPKEGSTVVSLLAESVFGRNGFYYVIQFSTALILILAANTSYADFPRLASLLARDRFLPRQLGSLGDRLVFSNGIMGLSIVAIALIWIFNGEPHALIPLYAVGVFLSFTLSQLGMILYHLRTKHPGWQKSSLVNFVGACTTLVILLVISATKFLHGAWMVIVFIPCLVILFKQIRTHYVLTAKRLVDGSLHSIDPVQKVRHISIVPISGIHQGVLDAARYAISISDDARACSVDIDAEASLRLQEQWKRKVSDVPLIVLKSPFRSVISPIIEYVEQVREDNPHDVITVIIPEFVTQRWYHKFLHNQTAILLYASLRSKPGIIVTSVRYHL